MHFSKEMYKQAMGKIENPKSQEETEYSINQKYKDDVLHGRLSDEFAGWDAANVYYDKEMLKKEGDRKIFILLPFIVIGIIMLVAASIYSYEHFNMRINGTVVKVDYTSKSMLLEHVDSDFQRVYDGYIFCWKEKTADYQLVHSTGQLLTCNKFFCTTREVILNVLYDDRINSADDAYYVDNTYYQRMMAHGIEPNEAYIQVYPEIESIYEYKKGEYVNLYYNEKAGETYLNLRILVRWWIVILVDIIVLIWNYITGRRLIRLVKEQRRLD